MARVAKVTRTIRTLEVTALCVDVQAGEPSNMTVDIPFTKKKDEMLKSVQAKITDKNVKAVHVVSVKEVEYLYEMTEADFMARAVKKEPRQKKTEPTEAAEKTE